MNLDLDNERGIIDRNIEDELKKSYIDYAMSVIVNRALPDVRDGLKPVHRRVLYSMKDLGLYHERPFTKSAKVVGHCLGSYHPHGDTAVYDTLVRMGQDFSLRYPLIAGQGNFGCFTGDTKIKMYDGSVKSFEELSLLPKNEIFEVFSRDANGKIVKGFGRYSRITKRAEYIEVFLDNGEVIKCTADHKFLLENNQYKAAIDLTTFDKLSSYPRFTGSPGHYVINIKTEHKVEDVYDITVDVYHNFLLKAGVFVHNSIDSDPAAAMRYTESKMSKLAAEMLTNLDENTVDFKSNYDNSTTEPSVLPSRFPNLLVNGSSGIAVGLTTNIPPHNLNEVIEACLYFIDNPDCNIDDLINFISAPDFPGGGYIMGNVGSKQMYKTGKGKIVMRGAAEIEENDKGTSIIITSLPYTVSKGDGQNNGSGILQKIAYLIKEKRILGVTDLRDESSKGDIRIVLELKKDANSALILNQLYKYTPLQSSFSANLVALVDNEPKLLNLQEIIKHYINFQQEILTKRTRNRLYKANRAAHILEGIIIALNNLDKAIKIIRESKNAKIASDSLIKEFSLTEIQAKEILQLRLQKLTSLEIDDIKKEYEEIKKKIEGYKDLLANKEKLLNMLKDELTVIKDKFGDERRTLILPSSEDLEDEDLIEAEEALIVLTSDNYVKRLNPLEFKLQHKGGKGVSSISLKTEDSVLKALRCHSHDYLLFFTNQKRMYKLKAWQLPKLDRFSKGRYINNFLSLEENEKVINIINTKDFDENKFLVSVTKNGIIKKTKLTEYDKNFKTRGILAYNLKDNDSLADLLVVENNQEIIVYSKLGRSYKINIDKIRTLSRTSSGMKIMRLDKEDELIGIKVFEDKDLLITSALGLAKQLNNSYINSQNRGAKGQKIIKFKNDDYLASVNFIDDYQEIYFVNNKGLIEKIDNNEINNAGKYAKGVIVMRAKNSTINNVVLEHKLIERYLIDNQDNLDNLDPNSDDSLADNSNDDINNNTDVDLRNNVVYNAEDLNNDLDDSLADDFIIERELNDDEIISLDIE